MSDGSFHGSATSETFRAAAGSTEADDIGYRSRQTAEQVLNALRDRAGDYLDLGRGKAAELAESVEQQIRSQPVTAVAVAAGVGFALGFLWTRRK
ncbi:MAG TPA: hypothetical protein VNH11_26420 [Pirellulales bacterium]|nr:hypothetical protein [Pirellulales bacterium]